MSHFWKLTFSRVIFVSPYSFLPSVNSKSFCLFHYSYLTLLLLQLIIKIHIKSGGDGETCYRMVN